MNLKNNKAFTLIEILAAIIILGIVLMIAIPSVTSVINRSKQRQLREDSKMFKALVLAKIAGDSSIELPDNKSAYFTIKSIDADSLSGSYDDRSYVEVKSCQFDLTTEKYVCSLLKSVLYSADGKTKAVDGVISSEKANLVSYLCKNSDTYWCYNLPNLSPEMNLEEEITSTIDDSEKVTIKFRLEDGTDYAIREIYKGVRITDIPGNPTKAGYSFKGWVKNNGVLVDLNTFSFDTNTVLIASWEENAVVAESCNKYDLIKLKNKDDGYEEFYVLKADTANNKIILLSKNGLVGNGNTARQATAGTSTSGHLAGIKVYKSGSNTPKYNDYISGYRTYLTSMGLSVTAIGSLTAQQLGYYCTGAKDNIRTLTMTCPDEAKKILYFDQANYFTEVVPYYSGNSYFTSQYYTIVVCKGYEDYLCYVDNATESASVRPVVTLQYSAICG